MKLENKMLMAYAVMQIISIRTVHVALLDQSQTINKNAVQLIKLLRRAYAVQ